MYWLFFAEGLFVTLDYHLRLHTLIKALHVGVSVPPYPPFLSLNSISSGES